MTLPRSKLNADDYPSGPNGMALVLRDRIAELEQAKGECANKAERREINQALHAQRDLLRWVKTRVSYVETPEDLGLV